MDQTDYVVTEVREISGQKKLVYLDDQPAFSLYPSEIKKYEIAQDKELSGDIYHEIMYGLLPKRAARRAMHLLESRDYTEYSIRAKLKEALYPDYAIDSAIEYVKHYGYIDDRRYIENYLICKGNVRSRMEIYGLLSQKGLDRDLIRNIFEEFYEENTDAEREALKKLILKRNPDIIFMTGKEKGKFLAYLTKKGFKIDLINGVIDEIVNK